MSTNVKIINDNKGGASLPLPTRKIAEGEQPSLGIRKKGPVSILTGNILSVDSDRQTMRVALSGDRDGDILENIVITQPFAGTSSFIAGMPEPETTVILAEGPDYVGPIGYIPKYRLGLRQEHAFLWDKDEIKTNDKNEFFYRFRRLDSGEVALSSSMGTELFLNGNVSIATHNGDNFKIRSEDNVIVNTSANHYVFSSGVWANSGIVQRNALEDTNRDEGSYAYQDTKADGFTNYNLRPDDDKEASDFFTEYRIEVEEKAKDDMPGNDVNRLGADTHRNPTAILSMGNFIGNNDRYEDTYGKILKPTLFNDYNDDEGDFFFDVLTGDEPSTIGMAMSLFAPNTRNAERGAFFGADKEGHFYHFLPAGTGGGICPGRSMSIVARGSKKEVWGGDSRFGNAWNMVLDGGVRWNIGNHGESSENPYKNLSMDVTTSRGVYFKYGIDQELTALRDFDKDSDPIGNINKYKKIEVIEGYERKEISMSRETIIEGSDRISINGKEEVSVGGSSNTSVGESFNLSVANSFNEKVTKEKQEGYGSRDTKITGGKSELTMMPTKPTTRGDIEETILGRGSKSTNITKGDISESILAKGNRSFFSTAGDFSVRTLKGDLSLNTIAGKVILKTTAGKAEVGSSLGLELVTKAGKALLKGSTVELKGAGPGVSGVVTVNSHKDYITGSPLMGSQTVRASL